MNAQNVKLSLKKRLYFLVKTSVLIQRMLFTFTVFNGSKYEKEK